jgi:hypothetical protein
MARGVLLDNVTADVVVIPSQDYRDLILRRVGFIYNCECNSTSGMEL